MNNPSITLTYGINNILLNNKLIKHTKQTPFEISVNDMIKGNILGASACNVMFVNKLNENEIKIIESADFEDWILWIILLRKGNGFFSGDVLGVYRIHNGGIWSSLIEEEKLIKILNYYDFISANFEDLSKEINKAKISFIKTWTKNIIEKNRKIFDYLLLKHVIKTRVLKTIKCLWKY
jgi:hypothetical protein